MAADNLTFGFASDEAPQFTLEELAGRTFGYWTVLSHAGWLHYGDPYYLCRCVCGKEREVRARSLARGKSSSCGCRRPPPEAQALKTGKTWDSVTGVQVICADCSAVCLRTGPMQRYCPSCSGLRATKRKADWARSNPSDPEEVRRTSRKSGAKKRSLMSDRGAVISEASRADLSEVFPDETGMAWVRRLSLPFSYAMSKNHKGAFSIEEGHVQLLRESKNRRHDIADAVAEALKGAPVVQGKLWISLIVHKPNHKGDAVNVLDLVCDGIKDATGVDDRWFAIKTVDWRIVKDAPELLIGLGQEVTEHHRVCSYCGRDLPYSGFVKNRSMPDGIGRACFDCHRTPGRKKSSQKHAR